MSTKRELNITRPAPGSRADRTNSAVILSTESGDIDLTDYINAYTVSADTDEWPFQTVTLTLPAMLVSITEAP